MTGPFDTWSERGGIAGSAVFVGRIVFYLWQRRRGGPTTAPIIGWIGRRLVTESLLITMTIKYKTAQAQVDRLEKEIEDAALRSGSPGGAAPSYDLPESTLLQSKTSTDAPSTSTSAKPDGDPA
jgi:hypothetical protein